MKDKHFKKGIPITCCRQLEKVAMEGGWIYLKDKPLHSGWWTSMQLRTLMIALRAKLLWEVVEVKK